jgi:hypothetical protein
MTMSLRTTLLTLLAAVAALSLVATATGAVKPGAVKPGDPCAKEGELADLAGGKIQCAGGTWKPYAPGAGAPTSPGSPASPTSPGSPGGASTVKEAAIFTAVGIALSEDTFGTGGKQVADVTAVRLTDGRIRLYAFVKPDGIRSAISTDATGTSFVAEPGRRITWAPGGQTRAYVLDDGRVRLFYLDGGSIKSAVSSDGLAFTDEGVRITTADAGFEPGGISIVKHGSGYRAYFSNLEKPGVQAERITRTATSADMLTWTVGPYVAGASGSIKDGASHPFAISDGTTIALYFNGDRGSFYGTLRATSTDGVTFTNERTILQRAGDPQLLTLPSGTTLLYYGDQIEGKGFGIRVARATASPVSGESAAGAAAKPSAKAKAKAKKAPAKKKAPPKKKAPAKAPKK